MKRIRKVTRKTSGLVVEVGKDDVVSIELSGSMNLAYVNKESDGPDPCQLLVTVDPMFANVEYSE